jgi:hypothetical protein
MHSSRPNDDPPPPRQACSDLPATRPWCSGEKPTRALGPWVSRTPLVDRRSTPLALAGASAVASVHPNRSPNEQAHTPSTPKHGMATHGQWRELMLQTSTFRASQRGVAPGSPWTRSSKKTLGRKISKIDNLQSICLNLCKYSPGPLFGQQRGQRSNEVRAGRVRRGTSRGPGPAPSTDGIRRRRS